MKVLAAFLLTCVLVASGSAVASAEDSNLKLRVLPMNCLFDTVDTGTNEIVYLTPAACNPSGSHAPNVNTTPDVLPPGVPDDVELPIEQAAGTTALPGPDEQAQPLTEDKNVITQLGEFKSFGDIIVGGSAYGSIVAFIVVPLIVMIGNFLATGGALTRLLSVAKNFFWE